MAPPGHAVVTGGSSGIGLALALRLAARGHPLSLFARDAGRLDAARKRLLAAGAPTCECHAADVGDRASARAAIDAACATLGTPELVACSAGEALPQRFLDLADDDFERLMRSNYFGTLHVVRAALPAMLEVGRGHLVLVSSGAGLAGIYGYAAYSPTKFAVRGLAEVLRAELRGTGVGISVVFPPDTDTPQLAAEEATKPAETRAIAGNAKVWSADAVARATLRGVARRRFYITPGWEMTALAALHSLLRTPLQAWFDRLARRASGGN